MSVLREVSALSSVNTFSECTAPKGSSDQLGAADSTGFLLLYTACLIVLFSLLIYAPFQIVSNMFIVVLVTIITLQLIPIIVLRSISCFVKNFESIHLFFVSQK